MVEENSVKRLNFSTEKEFREVADLALDQLRDIKQDWKLRMEALSSVQGIVLGNSSAKFPDSFDSFLLKGVVPLGLQMLDLRSAIAKKACSTIELMATELGNTFDLAAERYLSANCLLKLILNGNKILSEAGHNAILVILKNVVSPKLFLKISDEIKGKNHILRGKCAQYLNCILLNYPQPLVEKYADIIETLIKIIVNDANADTRASGRACYCSYANLFPKRAAALHNRFSAAVQKAIADSQFSGKVFSPSSSVVIESKTTYDRKCKSREPIIKQRQIKEKVPNSLEKSWKVPENKKTVERSSSSKQNPPVSSVLFGVVL